MESGTRNDAPAGQAAMPDTPDADRPLPVPQGRGPKEARPADAMIGSRVREIRRRRGMSQRELAKALHVTGVQLHRYERGLTRIAASRLLDIANVLQVPLQAITGPAHAVRERPPALEREEEALLRAFEAVEDPGRRAAVLTLLRSMASDDKCFRKGLD